MSRLLYSLCCLAMLCPASLAIMNGPPGDTSVGGMKYVPANQAKLTEVSSAIAQSHGPGAQAAWDSAVASGNLTVVNSAGRSGRSDGTTIAIDFDTTEGAQLATEAMHELEHWERSSVEAAATGDPNALDPLVNCGPCGICEHAAMGFADMQTMYAACGDWSEAVQQSVCESWEGMVTNLSKANQAAAAAGCMICANGTYPVDYDVHGFFPKPDCCDE